MFNCFFPGVFADTAILNSPDYYINILTQIPDDLTGLFFVPVGL